MVSFRLLALVERIISESCGEAFKTARTPAVSETEEKSGTTHISVTTITTPSPAITSKRQVSRPCQKARVRVGGMNDFLCDGEGRSLREVMVATRCKSSFQGSWRIREHLHAVVLLCLTINEKQ